MSLFKTYIAPPFPLIPRPEPNKFVSLSKDERGVFYEWSFDDWDSGTDTTFEVSLDSLKKWQDEGTLPDGLKLKTP